MRALLLQFLPERSPQLKVRHALALLASEVAVDHRVKTFEVSRGNARGPYVNVRITSQNREFPHVWALVKDRVLSHRLLGVKFQRSCIVTCEGSRGWNNHLLLHHFDSTVRVDDLGPV
jgi:hypothetical protein